MTAHTPGGWLPNLGSEGCRSTVVDASDRTLNVGLVDAAEPVPWSLRFRPLVRVAAGMCGSCSRLVDTDGRCACSD